MSVIRIDDEKYARIHSGLQNRADRMQYILRGWYRERNAEDKVNLENAISYFVHYLKVSNQICWNMQYTDDQGDIPQDDFKAVLPYNTKELLDSLESVSYNIVTNDGTVVDIGEVADRLHNLISQLRAEIIRNREERPMKLLKRKTMRKLWANGKDIVRKGTRYHVGRMSYGDYFLEPSPQLGETEGFRSGTIWIPRRIN